MIKCLIIDDEQLAREMLQAYALQIPTLEVVQLCQSTLEATNILEKEAIDLLFLDIQMPQQNGLDFLANLKNQAPKVILTTAYSDYALQGFELDVVDYLLKPISFARFQQAVDKVSNYLELEQKAQQYEEEASNKEQFIMVHSEHKHHKILLHDIIYIESLKEYVRYHTQQGKIIELNSMKKLEKNLPANQFIRIHRSYIVATDQIKGYDNGHLVLKTPLELPIGKTYKKEILQKFFK